MEVFLFLSCFTTAYRTFQIIEATGNKFGVIDILKIIFRKYIRLAIPYYLMWIILWILSSRITSGPIWHMTNITFETCSNTGDFLATLFFVGNLYPNKMAAY